MVVLISLYLISVNDTPTTNFAEWENFRECELFQL